MMKPEQVTEMQEIHAAMESGKSVAEIAAEREISEEGVKMAVSGSTLARYKRYLKAKSQGLERTIGL